MCAPVFHSKIAKYAKEQRLAEAKAALKKVRNLGSVGFVTETAKFAKEIQSGIDYAATNSLA